MKFLLLSLIFFAFCSCGSTRPDNLGIAAKDDQESRLHSCPSSPNCVVSFYQSESPDHYLKPFSTNLSAKESCAVVKKVLSELKSFEIIKQTEIYLYAEYTSSFFRFVDDVEFLCRENFIHFRSASRIGHSDLGANKKRIESLRSAVSNRL